MQVSYNLSEKKLGNIDVLFPSEIQGRHGFVFTDNSTLVSSSVFFFGSGSGETETEWENVKRRLGTLKKDPDPMSAFNLIQSLVIYENLVVDGFVLANDQNATAFASGFPQVIKALYMTDEQRERVARVVEPMIPSLETLVSSHPDLKDPAQLIASMDVDKGLFEEFAQSPQAREEDLNRTLEGEVLTLHIPAWLARSGNHIPRTLFYALLAKAFRIPYAPHPVRCPLLEVFAEKQLDAAHDTILHFKGLVGKAGKNLASAFNGYDLRLDIPPVAQYVIQTTERRRDLAERTLEVRASKHAKDFRKWCFELQAALAAGLPGLVTAKKLYGELEKACELWSQDLQDHVTYKRRRLRITSVLKILDVETEIEVKDPILFGGDLKHLLFLNDLVNVLG